MLPATALASGTVRLGLQSHWGTPMRSRGAVMQRSNWSGLAPHLFYESIRKPNTENEQRKKVKLPIVMQLVHPLAGIAGGVILDAVQHCQVSDTNHTMALSGGQQRFAAEKKPCRLTAWWNCFFSPLALGIFWHSLVGVVSYSFPLSNAFCDMFLRMLGELLRAPHQVLSLLSFFLESRFRRLVTYLQ